MNTLFESPQISAGADRVQIEVQELVRGLQPDVLLHTWKDGKHHAVRLSLKASQELEHALFRANDSIEFEERQRSKAAAEVHDFGSTA